MVSTSIRVQYDVKLTKNIALEFKINNLCNIKQEEFDTRKMDYVNVDLSFPIFDRPLPLELLTEEVLIELCFTDEIKTPYKQIIKGNIRDLQISPPIPVVDSK